MLKLYYTPGVCSMAIHVVMEELGLTFETQAIDLTAGEHKQPEYLKINPRGQVASLQTEHGVLTENVAIIEYLNDNYGGNMLPKAGFERAVALQWLLFVNTGIHGAYSKALFSVRANAGDAVIETALQNIQDQWDEIERHLTDTGNSFLAGDTLTAGDVYLAVVSNWSFLPRMPKFGEKTTALLKKIVATPSYQKVLAKENVEYQAVA